MEIRNLYAALGAEVLGIELAAPLRESEVDAIETAWSERLVVVFHGQSLSDPQLIAFSENFGELDPPGPNPYPRSTSFPTWSRTGSPSAASATARRCGTPI